MQLKTAIIYFNARGTYQKVDIVEAVAGKYFLILWQTEFAEPSADLPG